MAQDESRSISENVRWSIQKRFQQGKAHCPTAFFLGYDTDKDGNLIINEQQAKTVRRIYKEFLDGNGTSAIANGLTRDKLKTGKGKTKWTGNSVYRILRNEKYCGDILMQKRVTIDFLTHKRVPNKGHQPQYFISDHHPAIISKEDWNAVQVELNRRYKMNDASKDGTPQKHSNRAVFSNVLYCGNCGEPLVRRTFTSSKNGQKYLYGAWKCRVADGRKEKVVCQSRSYREVAMEHSFMKMLQEMKKEQDKLLKEVEVAIADVDLDDWEKDRMEFLQVEINDLDEKLSEVATSAGNSPAGDVYDDMSMQIAEEIEALQDEWDELNEKQHEALIIERNLNWLIEELNKLDDFDPENERTEFREDIFKRIVKRGDVSNDGSILYELNIGVTRRATDNDKAIWKINKI